MSFRWLQVALVFCVWSDCCCHWNTAVYRVREREYAGNVNGVGLLLSPLGRANSLACECLLTT